VAEFFEALGFPLTGRLIRRLPPARLVDDGRAPYAITACPTCGAGLQIQPSRGGCCHEALEIIHPDFGRWDDVDGLEVQFPDADYQDLTFARLVTFRPRCLLPVLRRLGERLTIYVPGAFPS
jgi:hypothetical protein